MATLFSLPSDSCEGLGAQLFLGLEVDGGGGTRSTAHVCTDMSTSGADTEADRPHSSVPEPTHGKEGGSPWSASGLSRTP